jgi:hypothetical protein
MEVSFSVGSCSILSFLSSSILILVILTRIRGRMDLPVTWFVILPPWSISRLFCPVFLVIGMVLTVIRSQETNGRDGCIELHHPIVPRDSRNHY